MNVGTGMTTLRATDGNITFRGNKDNVGRTNEKANAIHLASNDSALTFAAREGQSIYFYDPVTTDNNSRTISINNLVTDTGRVVFDGSDYTRQVDRHSAVYGTTTVGYGELALKGNAIYGAARNTGSFTLNNRATLTADEAMNQIWANTITLNGTVDIADGGTLLLSAAQGVGFNGTLNVGLGLESSGFLSVTGNLAFGNNALLSVYGDDSLFTEESWSKEYNLFDMFGATGSITGLANLKFDASWFDAYDGFSYTLNDGILTLSYTAAEVPEPATLVILGLAAAGLPVARRWRKK